MAGLSLYAQKKVLDHLLLVATFSPPPGVFMSLHTADPTDSGSTVNEVPTSGTNYARFSLAGIMSAADLMTGITTLISVVNIGPASTDWGLITHVGFWDAVTAGNMLFSGQLSTAQDTPLGKQFQLLAGQFQVQAL